MDREPRIAAAVAARGWHPRVGERVARLLDGVEDRVRLRCCGSGCSVCVEELRRVLVEVESGALSPARPAAPRG